MIIALMMWLVTPHYFKIHLSNPRLAGKGTHFPTPRQHYTHESLTGNATPCGMGQVKWLI